MAELHTDDTFMWENKLMGCPEEDYDRVPREERGVVDPLANRITHQRGPKAPSTDSIVNQYEEVDWSKAPRWANYWAMDDDGAAFWYEKKPTCVYKDGAWHDFSDWSIDPAEDGSRIEGAPSFRKDPNLWRDSLLTRPEKALEEMVQQAEELDLYDDEIVHDLTKPLSQQIGGDHYRQGDIQPIEYIHANDMDFFSGNVVKYITRWKYKSGLEDLKKAKHYIELLIEQEYGSE